MDNDLYKLKNYSLDIPFIFSNFIREYDIKKANINIMYKNGVLSKTDYEYFLKSPRMQRQIAMGNLQKNGNIQKILDEGIIEAKQIFFEINNIQTSEVFSIKNDAVYLLNKIPSMTIFDNIEFVNKNTYSSFMKLLNLEIYYGLDKINDIELFDVKGINDTVLERHKDYMIDFIIYILYLIETESIETVIKEFTLFYNDYTNRKLNINYYREFNSYSLFKIPYKNLLISSIKDTSDNKASIDISHNLQLLREMYGYITTIYFNAKNNRRN